MPSRSRSSAWRADSVPSSCVTPVPAPAGSAENMRNRAPTLSRAVLPGTMRAIRKRVRLSTSVCGLHPTPMTPSASHSPNRERSDGPQGLSWMDVLSGMRLPATPRPFALACGDGPSADSVSSVRGAPCRRRPTGIWSPGSGASIRRRGAPASAGR